MEMYKIHVRLKMQAAKKRGLPVCVVCGGGWFLHRFCYAEGSSGDEQVRVAAQVALDTYHMKIQEIWNEEGAFVIDATKFLEQFRLGRDLCHYRYRDVTKDMEVPNATALRHLLTKCSLQVALHCGYLQVLEPSVVRVRNPLQSLGAAMTVQTLVEPSNAVSFLQVEPRFNMEECGVMTHLQAKPCGASQGGGSDLGGVCFGGVASPVRFWPWVPCPRLVAFCK